MQQTKKFKMADAISPYLAVSCELRLQILSPLRFDFVIYSYTGQRYVAGGKWSGSKNIDHQQQYTDWIMILHELYYKTYISRHSQITNHVTFKRENVRSRIGNPLVCLLLLGLFSYSNNA